MIKSHHLYPFFPDLIENQRRSVQYFWEKGLLEEFELFSYILGKKKNLQMILHGSKFMLQRPKYSLHEAVRKQKSYSVSLYLPVEFKWYENSKFPINEANSRLAQYSLLDKPIANDIERIKLREDGFSKGNNNTPGLTLGIQTALGIDSVQSAQEKASIQSSQKKQLGYWVKSKTQNELLNNQKLKITIDSPEPLNLEKAKIEEKASSQTFPVLLGDIPLMTERGSFLINGSARVLVNQIVRCPSVYFKVKIDHKNRRTYIASFLSDYGSWLRLETDYKSRIWVRIDKSQRVSIYALLRSLGFPESFLKYQLKYYSFLFASRETYYTEKPTDAIQYLWKKLTPGRWNSIQGCYSFLYNKFFNPRRYSIGPVGRIRLNKRLNRKNNRFSFANPPGDRFQRKLNHGMLGPLQVEENSSLTRRGLEKTLNSFSPNRIEKIKQNNPCLPTLTPEDIFMALDLLIQLHYGEGYIDDIDHLKNRRVRLPGELIQNQFRLALSRITQIATEKITKFEIEKDLRDRSGLLKLNSIKIDQVKPIGIGVGAFNKLSKLNTKQLNTGKKVSQEADSIVSWDTPTSFTGNLNERKEKPIVENEEQKYSSNKARNLRSSGFKTTAFRQSQSESTFSKNTFQAFPMKNFFQAQLFGSSIRELFHTSQLSQYMDQTNPLAEITHKRRLSSLGPGGIGRDQAGFAVREIHPSHFGRICPIETPEGPNAGLVGSLASYCRITENGFLQSPYFATPKKSLQDHFLSSVTKSSKAFLNSKVTEGPDWFLFSAEVEDESYMCSENVFCEESEQNMARPELTHQKTSMSSELEKVENSKSNFNVYPIRYKQEFLTVEKNQIQFFSISPIQMISLATSLIPFLEHDDANRALMGSNMQRQAVPVIFAEKPLVGTGLELQAARDSSTVVLAKQTGQIIYVDSEQIIVESSLSRIDNLKPLSSENCRAPLPVQHEIYKLQNYWRSNQNTCLRQRAQVKQGEWVEKGDLLADGSATEQGEIALGKNILLAYMPWEGYNFEDAIVINERLVQEDIYTSIHIDRYDIEIRETSYGKEKITRDLPYINSEQTRNLDTQGIIFPGTWVEEGDILVGKVTPISPPKPTPEYRLLLAIFETKPLPFKETSLRIPQGVEGRVLDCIIDYQVNESSGGVTNNLQTVSTQRNLLVPQKVQIFLAHKRKIQLGDKMSGRHGNKGIVSLILPPQDMPFLQDGTPVDIVLNPLGVPSRMNVGQVLECLFGLAGHYLQEHYRLLPFDEMYGKNASRGLVYKKLYEASCRTGQDWIFDPNSPGKSHLFDGRTGELFHQPILIGYSYMFKLIHLVDEKMHARSTGPYSLVTQQPLGGRSKHGGQRLGEMEVWALEGFGAASILQEFLTVKSDEIYARNTFLFHLMKRRKLPRPGLPESFRVLVHELQSLCMSVYYNPDFRLTYPSLIGWDGLFLLSSKKFPTLQQLSNLKNI
jgi:DNA-directed RNA polymerase beta subunit